jgi:hypothetical protein
MAKFVLFTIECNKLLYLLLLYIIILETNIKKTLRYKHFVHF